MPLTKLRTSNLLSGSVANGTLNATALTGQSSSTAADDNDLILIYDNTASALRKQTRADFFTAGIPTLTGSNTFAGTNKFSAGLSGSLTRLTDGTSYLAGGTNVTITSASNGQVVIGTSGGNTLNAAYDQGGAGAGKVITADSGPVELVATSNTNATTTLLTLAVSGTVTGGGNAGGEILFKIPVSGDSETGAAIRGVKFASSDSNSSGELQFFCTDNDETLDLRLKADGTGVAVQGAGSTLAYPSSGDAFIVSTSANAATFVVNNSSGKVGIGSRGPEELLTVEDSESATTIQINNNATTGDPQLAFALSDTKKFTMGVDDSDSDKFKIGTTSVATSTRLTIDSSGNVGIGETSPSYNLHISSTGDAALFLEADTNNVGEGDNPFIKLSQDNTVVQSIIGLCGATDKDPENNTYTGVVDNNMLLGTTTNYGLQLGTNDNVRMTIANSGEITYPYQPCFSAYLSAYQYNIADNGTIIFDAEAFDVGSDFNTTTGTFTAPVTGKYLLTYSVDVSSLDSAASYYWLKLITSNRNYYAPFIPTSLLLSSDGRMTFQNTVVADMDASDTAYITLDRSGGVTQADIVGGGSQYSWFHGYLLG